MDNADDPRIEPLLALARKDFSFEDAIRQWAIEKILAADILQDFLALLADQGQALEAWGKSKESRREAVKLHAEAEKKLSQKLDDASARGRAAANTLHNKPGGSRQKVAAIRNLWASGKYSSRDLCAEQECAHLAMSFSAARKALRNAPKP
jgi:hypothetical protein